MSRKKRSGSHQMRLDTTAHITRWIERNLPEGAIHVVIWAEKPTIGELHDIHLGTNADPQTAILLTKIVAERSDDPGAVESLYIGKPGG